MYLKYLFFVLVTVILSSKADANDENVVDDLQVYYSNLRKKFPLIKNLCGQICENVNVTKQSGSDSKFAVLKAKVDCENLFKIELLDKIPTPPIPPRKIPKFFKDDFTLQGKLKVAPSYFYEFNREQDSYINWNKEDIDVRVKEIQAGVFSGSYTKEDRANVFETLSNRLEVKNAEVLVIGSQTPWIESMVLALGAKYVTTVDYTAITCDHPKITTLTPKALAELYLNSPVAPSFDLIVSFSSLEHSGLGRYGDELNPFGDRIEMARAWCLAKTGGKMLIGVPSGEDNIVFNACKVYGNSQYPLIFTNWKQDYSQVHLSKQKKDCIWCYQPLTILSK